MVVCCSEQTVFSHFTSKTPVNCLTRVNFVPAIVQQNPSPWENISGSTFRCHTFTSHNVSFAKYTEPMFIIFSFFSLFVIEKLLCFNLSDRWSSQILTGCCESTCNIMNVKVSAQWLSYWITAGPKLTPCDEGWVWETALTVAYSLSS